MAKSLHRTLEAKLASMKGDQPSCTLFGVFAQLLHRHSCIRPLLSLINERSTI